MEIISHNLYGIFTDLFKTDRQLVYENAMLRSQLTLYRDDVENGKRPKSNYTITIYCLDKFLPVSSRETWDNGRGRTR